MTLAVANEQTVLTFEEAADLASRMTIHKTVDLGDVLVHTGVVEERDAILIVGSNKGCVVNL